MSAGRLKRADGFHCPEFVRSVPQFVENWLSGGQMKLDGLIRPSPRADIADVTARSRFSQVAVDSATAVQPAGIGARLSCESCLGIAAAFS